MGIIGIFVNNETFEGLHSFVYETNPGDKNHHENDPECEFEKLFSQWTDVEYVSNYLLKNKSFCETEYFNGSTMDDLIEKVLSEANALEELIYTYATDGNNNDDKLQMIFKPLHNNEHLLPVHQKTKAKASKGGLLRIYAIRLGDNTFIVTGGAIKLTHLMEEHEDTIKELEKIETAKKYLRAHDIQFVEDLIYYYEPE
ncbi:MAG TPA: hypothetical protein VG738_14385 [Chitinophagaceae bacterium]|nr:hypothetical protein [Chitinophagaceae bacterium]